MRDALLGSPVLDLDFSVEGDAVELANLLAGSLGGRATAHRRFGTATVFAGSCRVDLVTARRETYPNPGDLPLVTPGDIVDDLARRDFSVNAMALPLFPRDAGIFDPHGGLDDLEAGIIRSLHRLSFRDDPTRMMRAVRYEQRFGFRLDEATLDDMDSCVASGHMDAVSGDRWRHELQRILEEDDPGPALARSAELGLLAGIHPALGKFEGKTSPGARRATEGPDAESGASRGDYWLAALSRSMSAPELESTIERLRLTGRQAAIARDTIVLRDSEPDIRAAAERPSELAAGLSTLEPAAVSAWAALTEDPSVAAVLRRYVGELRFVRPRLTGDTLLAMGVPEGPAIGAILSRLLKARLDGEVVTENDEMDLARGLLAGSRAGLRQ